jgi:hypothetical protein
MRRGGMNALLSLFGSLPCPRPDFWTASQVRLVNLSSVRPPTTKGRRRRTSADSLVPTVAAYLGYQMLLAPVPHPTLHGRRSPVAPQFCGATCCAKACASTLPPQTTAATLSSGVARVPARASSAAVARNAANSGVSNAASVTAPAGSTTCLRDGASCENGPGMVGTRWGEGWYGPIVRLLSEELGPGLVRFNRRLGPA